jgi:hypothetical protein
MSESAHGGIEFEFELPFEALHIVSNEGRRSAADPNRAAALNTVAYWLALTTADLWGDVPESEQLAWLDSHEEDAVTLRKLLARVSAAKPGGGE